MLPLHADERRPFRGPLPAASVDAVWRILRLDGRTRIVATRAPGGVWWRAGAGPLTAGSARLLRAEGLSEVVLRRGLRRTTVPLSWVVPRD